MIKGVQPTRNSSSESDMEGDKLTVDVLRIATFTYDHNERANGDKDWMHKLRDRLVFDWIHDRNRQYANITQESFRDFLRHNLRDYAETDLHSQLMNAYAKCMLCMRTGSNKNNSSYRRRRSKRLRKEDSDKNSDEKRSDLDLHPRSSLCDDNAHQKGPEDEAAQFNLNDLD